MERARKTANLSALARAYCHARSLAARGKRTGMLRLDAIHARLDALSDSDRLAVLLIAEREARRGLTP